jgi:ABC-2 type transport system permease protein
MAAQFHIFKAIVRTTGRLIEIDPGEGGPIRSDIIRSLILLVAGAKGDQPDAEALNADPEARFRELAGRERLVGLDVGTAGSGTPVPSGNAQSVPGILTMSVLMGTLIYGAVFLTMEKRDGTLRRQLCLPLSRAHVFTGKLLGRIFLAAAQIFLLLLAGKFVFGLPLEEYLAGLTLLMVCYALAVTGMSTLLGALVRTDEQAGSLGWIITMAMAGLGGCWWPSEVMPEWMWNAAHLLPTAWAMDGFHALISFGRGIEGVLLPCAVLAAFGVVFSLLGIRFLRTAGI